jgi:hypothetical protein
VAAVTAWGPNSCLSVVQCFALALDHLHRKLLSELPNLKARQLWHVFSSLRPVGITPQVAIIATGECERFPPGRQSTQYWPVSVLFL